MSGDPNRAGTDHDAPLAASVRIRGLIESYPERGDLEDELYSLAADVDGQKVRIYALEDLLAEIRSGYDEYYESTDLTRLLNGEAKLRDLYPPAVRHA